MAKATKSVFRSLNTKIQAVGIPTSNHKEHPLTFTVGTNPETRDDAPGSSRESTQKQYQNLNADVTLLQVTIKRQCIFVSVLAIVCIGIFGGLVWNCLKTDVTCALRHFGVGKLLKSSHIEHVDQQWNQVKILMEAMDKILPKVAQNEVRNKTNDDIAPTWTGQTTVGESNSTQFSDSTTSTSTTYNSVLISTEMSTANQETTKTTLAIAHATETTMSTTTQTIKMANNTAFEVLQSKEVNYRNYTFLAVQVQVPNDGLSKSENWCSEYQLLCEHFSRRPTGCGTAYTRKEYKLCSDLYNSDRDIENVLGCNPSWKIAEVANMIFENLSTPAEAHRNSFGFHTCNHIDCHKTIEGSQQSVYMMRDFWEKGQRIMYTVCH